MTLLEILRPGRLVALVGGGGKTTTGERLVMEAAAGKQRAIFTTTTKTSAGAPFPVWLFESAQEAVATLQPDDLPALVARRGPTPEKLVGFAPEEIPALFGAADFVVVEADGARRLPLKAYGPGEPPLPPGITDFVAVVGLAALGRRVEPGGVHRPERFTERLGVESGALVTEDVILRAVCGANGYLSAAPAGAVVSVLLWGVGAQGNRAAADRIARALIADRRVRRVIAGDLLTSPPELQVYEQSSGPAAPHPERGVDRTGPTRERE